MRIQQGYTPSQGAIPQPAFSAKWSVLGTKDQMDEVVNTVKREASGRYQVQDTTFNMYGRDYRVILTDNDVQEYRTKWKPMLDSFTRLKEMHSERVDNAQKAISNFWKRFTEQGQTPVESDLDDYRLLRQDLEMEMSSPQPDLPSDARQWFESVRMSSYSATDVDRWYQNDEFDLRAGKLK